LHYRFVPFLFSKLFFLLFHDKYSHGVSQWLRTENGRQKSVLALVSLLINISYCAMDASDFCGIIDDFKQISPA